MKNLIVIDDKVIEVNLNQDNIISDMNSDRQWYIFRNEEKAGEEARKYFKGMAENDPGEFINYIGGETLLQWALGNYAYNANSLREWFNDWLDIPNEHFASYDGHELCYLEMNNHLLETLGVDRKDINYIVAYRHI